jgi:error-prone DNA polymerase
MVHGFSRAGAECLLQARAQAPFADVTDLAHRARFNRRDIEALAAAGALAGIAGHRYRARWSVAGLEPPLPLLRQAAIPEALPLLRPPTEGEDVAMDYASLGLTLGRHPLALIRKYLLRLKLLSAAEILALPHGAQVRAAGLVVCRQHPSSSKGVIFVTLEDETGHTNVIVWSGLAQRQRRELLQARLMGVIGEVQREGEVLHIIARHLEDHSPLLGRLETHSRDFH